MREGKIELGAGSDVLVVECSYEDGLATIRMVSEEIDSYTAPLLREQLREVIEDGQVDRVVFDMENVSYIDSTALGVLVGSLKRASGAEKAFVLRIKSSVPSPETGLVSAHSVEGILRITRLVDVFTIEKLETPVVSVD